MVRAQRADARRNRDRLLAAASAVFEREGAEASLEEVARTAGVGIGTLYRHFPTRADLLEAVYRRNVDELCDGAAALLETLPPDRALEEWMQRFVRYVPAKKGMATHLKSIVSAESELFAYSHGRVTGTFETLIRAAAAAGSIRSDVDGEDVLRALSGICLVGDQQTQQQVCRLSHLLMDGLRYQAPADAAG